MGPVVSKICCRKHTIILQVNVIRLWKGTYQYQNIYLFLCFYVLLLSSVVYQYLGGAWLKSKVECQLL
jgi:hypothetical protein